jgi:hypothetical protein
MGRSELPRSADWAAAALAALFLGVGVGSRWQLWRQGLMPPAFRFFYLLTLGYMAAGVAFRATRKKRSLMLWQLGAVILLLTRALAPWLDPLPLVWSHLPEMHLFAYDGGFGTWAWILLHAAGYLTAVRLFRERCLGRAVVLFVTWTLATMTLLCNGPYGGDELLCRWRD